MQYRTVSKSSVGDAVRRAGGARSWNEATTELHNMGCAEQNLTFAVMMARGLHEGQNTEPKAGQLDHLVFHEMYIPTRRGCARGGSYEWRRDKRVMTLQSECGGHPRGTSGAHTKRVRTVWPTVIGC